MWRKRLLISVVVVAMVVGVVVGVGAVAMGAAGDGVIAVGRVGGGIVLIDEGGRRIRTLTSSAGARSDWAPAWSPDATRIAFTRTTDGRRSFHVYVMRADGTDIRQITHGRFDDQPAWSPDGRWIAYASATGVRLVRPDGSGDRLVVHDVAASPSWIANGRLAYSLHPEIPEDWPPSCQNPAARCGWVWASHPDGSDRRPTVVHGRDAHWSPDGRTVVFTPPNGGVSTIPAAGGRARFLGRGYMANWSPDGSRIVYARLGTSASRDSIWVMSRNGSNPHRIIQGAQTPAWRPR